MASPLWPTLDEIISEISTRQNTPCRIVAGPIRGFSNSVYEVQFEDSRTWCLRVPHDADSAYFSTVGTALLKRLKEVKPAILAPSIILSTDYYTLMERVDGQALMSWNTGFLPKERRELLLDGLAAFLVSLWTCQAIILEQGEIRP